jgi:uncharacterized protein YbbK (DUF523 family)
MRFSHAPHEDVTEKMADFASAHLATLGELSGFIVCAKSPSCGMERVRLYDEKGNRGRKEGVGLFTGALMARYPWLPVEEMAGCTIRCCGRILSSAFSPCMNSTPCAPAA